MYVCDIYIVEKMVIKIFTIIGLIQASLAATENNAPKINNTKFWNCTDEPGDCEISFVVEPFMSMTYYDFEYDQRKLVGCRARFIGEGILTTLRNTVYCNDISELQPPITTDGEFRPLITINGHMPGPTIIARRDQRLLVTVYNELPNVEGISIHWHGMHQRGTTSMDGVAFISQNPIPAYQSYKYDFIAFPAGTHWYHAHSGAHRTDGLYGALIVQDELLGDLYDEDLPEQHTLLLMDWHTDPSIDLFYQIRSSLSFFDENFREYKEARAPDGSQIAPTPFWSGIINDKGRHYNESGKPNLADLNVFNVTQGGQYRFRLIGAQALYAFKFSIQDHLLTVVATDGSQMDSITDVHYLIINTGERYDVIVNASNDIGNYWIIAQTLETGEGGAFYSPIDVHKAEAVLHYEGAPDYISDSSFPTATSSSWDCTQINISCRFVNCPYNYTECINVEDFRYSTGEDIDDAIYDEDIKTLFYNFGFEGEKSTEGSSVDGINFRFPSVLPSNSEEFLQQVCKERGCDHTAKHQTAVDQKTGHPKTVDHCACTQVIDISDVSAVELVLTNYPRNATGSGTGNATGSGTGNATGNGTNSSTAIESSHPVHLHGHGFYVVKIGYPNYNESGYYESPNPDITCTAKTNNGICDRFITVTGKQIVNWANGERPEDLILQSKSLVKKDTVIVPFGGYTVIRFLTDNPGWWLLHCHIEIHQLEGMAVVIQEKSFQKGSGQGKKYRHTL